MIKIIFKDNLKDKWILDKISDLETETEISLSGYLKQESDFLKISMDIKQIFKIIDISVINAFDNTHFYGSDEIGVMVAVENGKFNKNKYRRYNFKEHHSAGDDGAMIFEMMSRRLVEIKNNQEVVNLLIIDGGRLQMEAVNNAMEKVGIYIPYICVKKGDKRNPKNDRFLFDQIEVGMIDNSVGLKFIQLARDEAHRFASNLLEKKRISVVK